MKIGQIENKIMDKIAYPVLFIAIALFIYSQWGRWGDWLWEMGGMLLSLAFACGIVCVLVFALILYPVERKKRVRLEQEIWKTQYMNAQIIYMDQKGEPCLKEHALKVRIIETLPDGSRRETYGIITEKGPNLS